MSSTGRIKQYPVVTPRIDSAIFTNTVVETTGANFVHIRGNIIFEVEDLDTNFIWSFQTEGAPGSVSRYGPVNYILYTNTLSGIAAVTKINDNNYTFETDAGDSGGRTYTILFQPYSDSPTIVTKTAGAALTGNIEIRATAQLYR